MKKKALKGRKRREQQKLKQRRKKRAMHLVPKEREERDCLWGQEMRAQMRKEMKMEEDQELRIQKVQWRHQHQQQKALQTKERRPNLPPSIN